MCAKGVLWYNLFFIFTIAFNFFSAASPFPVFVAFFENTMVYFRYTLMQTVLYLGK